MMLGLYGPNLKMYDAKLTFMVMHNYIRFEIFWGEYVGKNFWNLNASNDVISTSKDNVELSEKMDV